MRDPDRIPEILDELEDIWVSEAPDLRLGQLLLNLVERRNTHKLYNWEDDRIIEELKDFYT